MATAGRFSRISRGPPRRSHREDTRSLSHIENIGSDIKRKIRSEAGDWRGSDQIVRQDVQMEGPGLSSGRIASDRAIASDNDKTIREISMGSSRVRAEPRARP